MSPGSSRSFVRLAHICAGRALEQPAAAEREQRIAAEQRALVFEPVGDVADGVAGDVEHERPRCSQRHLVAVVDRDVDARECARASRALPTMVQPVARFSSRLPPV